MNKISSKILILIVTLGIFLLPLTPSFEIKSSKFSVLENTTKAQGPGDIDGDGIPDFQDNNIDGDAFNNGDDPDVDNDGIPNAQDTDPEFYVNFTDINNDNIPDPVAPTTDPNGGTSIINFTATDTGGAAAQTSNAQNSSISQDDPDYLVCWGGIDEGIIMKGCIASLFYIVWEIAAFLAEMAGGFLDFFVFYSLNSDSYSGEFVSQGWKVVRDVANIFFIIALLYVAIKTILSLNVSNNKKLIGTIVIIALLINFSLFVTKVVIDMTNILAKVFYNNIESVDRNGNPAEGDEGEKSISVGMISKYDPQKIISESAYNADGGAYLFISVTVILVGVTLYTAYMFMAVALLFVARVVTLWISMIFSPIAFISYTVPFSLGSMGHDKWWSDLFKSAFMAPIFIFFLYLIVLFLDIGTSITYTESDEVFQKIMAVVIPFAILFGLLKKAKSLAEEYSGDIGKMMPNLGTMATGVVSGAVLGGGAALLRGTVGRKATSLADKDWVNKWAANSAVGDIFQKSMQKIGSSNLDIRSVKIAGKNLAGVTGANLGEGRKGGFMQIRDERTEKREKRAKELEVNEYSPLKKELKEKELAQQVILNENKSALDKAAKDIEDKRQQMNDTVDPKEKERRGKELQKLKDELKAEKERIGLPAIEKEISAAKKVIEKENIKRANNFANSLGTPLSKVIDHITGLGQYSTQGLEEAQYRIKMRLAVAANSGGDKGGHGGGSHGGGSPKPTPPPKPKPAPKAKPADDHDEHEHSGDGGEQHH